MATNTESLTPSYETVIAHCDPAFVDDRGEITNILDGVDIKHIARITSVANSRRGGHYHPAQSQYIYVESGELVSYSTPVSANGKQTRNNYHVERARAGDLLYCPPMVAHSYFFVWPTVFLSITTGIRNPGTYKDDTIPFKMHE